MNTYRILTGDVRASLPLLDSGSVQCCVTSPPYWGLRSYLPGGHPDKALEIGLEKTPQEYVDALVAVFREVRRVLRDDGTLWLNLGDSYAQSGGHTASGKNSMLTDAAQRDARNFAAQKVPAGFKAKDLVGVPWMVAFALRADGWYLRSDIIWAKPNPMPESVTDRPTKAHEYVFLLSKSARYYFGQDDVREPAVKGDAGAGARNYVVGSQHGRERLSQSESSRDDGRNVRSVWPVASEPCAEAHFAVMPRTLARRCILAGCPIGGTVLDPFGGAGTVALEAVASQRNAVICELNPAYADIARRRLRAEVPMFATEAA